METLERVFREESGGILATLIRAVRDFQLAEDALQEAFAEAARQWKESGPPEKPGAWISTVARRRAIDRLRREGKRTEKRTHAARQRLEEARERVQTLEADEPRDRLRLVFTCCHPALDPAARVALTLRTLGGLTTKEIASAFLVPEPTMAQRLVRAKRKIRDAGIPYRIPAEEELEARLSGVLTALYLIFNEGYAASDGDVAIRRGLCADAIRLARDLVALMPEEPEAEGLLALMLLHDARRDGRLTEDGHIVRMGDQDRTRWDPAQIAEGKAALEHALSCGRAGPYQIQAAIAALHAEAPTSEGTDWAQIAALYERLFEMTGSPVVALNGAVAVAESEGPQTGLDRITALEHSLRDYLWLHTTRGELLVRLGRPEEARECYRRALTLARNATQTRFVERRLAAL